MRTASFRFIYRKIEASGLLACAPLAEKCINENDKSDNKTDKNA